MSNRWEIICQTFLQILACEEKATTTTTTTTTCHGSSPNGSPTLYTCRLHAVMLELAFASGLSHPPSQLLTLHDPCTFQPACQKWLKEFRTVPRSLKSLARCSIRHSLGNTILHSAPKLPLPALLVDYVVFAEAVLGTS